MNYTIKSVNDNIIIGTQLFTTTAIDLVSISCLKSGHFVELSEAVQTLVYVQGEGSEQVINTVHATLEILQNGIVVEKPVKVLSDLFELICEKEKTAKELLIEDFQDFERFGLAKITSETTKNIDKSYQKRIKVGVAFYGKMRAELVETLLEGEKTPEQLYAEVDAKLTKAKVSLWLGDLQTAYTDVQLSDIENELKTKFLTELAVLVQENY